MSVPSRARRGRGPAALLVVVLLAAVSCGVPDRWRSVLVAPPPPARPVPFRPADIACTAPATCVVVGAPADRVVARHLNHTLVGDGRTFTPALIPSSVPLDQVSCATPAWCLAGGEARGETGPTRRFVLRRGTSWSTVDLPLDRVTAHACAREGWCLGVGRTGGAIDPATGRAFAAVFDGERFSEVTPADAVDGTPLSAVACGGPSWCLAAGAGAGGPGLHGFVWDGDRFVPESMPALPAGPEAPVSVAGLACGGVGRCLLLGTRADEVLAWVRTSAGWVPADLPATPGWELQQADLACGSPASCVLVGEEYQAETGEYRATARRWDGTGWREAADGLPADRSLWAASCSGPTACTAVGIVRTSYDDGEPAIPALHHWNGTSWSPATAGVALRPSELEAVSCTGPMSCLAVGEASIRLQPSSRGWSALPATDPTSRPGQRLVDVSCGSPTFCVAIGLPTLAGTAQPAWGAPSRLFRWTGSGFVDMLGPLSLTTTLSDVSCAADGSCLALGYEQAMELGRLVAYSWNGLLWTRVSTPAWFQVRDVSCTAANACVAVGWSRFRGLSAQGGPGGAMPPGPDHAVAYAWDGARWRDLAVPPLAGATDTFFNGVSCPSATWCAAAGSAAVLDHQPGSGGRGPHDPFVAIWDGASWTLDRVPAPSDMAYRLYRFEDVSCASPTRCAAVGATGRTGEPWIAEEPVSALWKGAAWRFLEMQTSGPELVATGVSCRSNSCWAVADGAVMELRSISPSPP